MALEFVAKEDDRSKPASARVSGNRAGGGAERRATTSRISAGDIVLDVRGERGASMNVDDDRGVDRGVDRGDMLFAATRATCATPIGRVPVSDPSDSDARGVTSRDEKPS